MRSAPVFYLLPLHGMFLATFVLWDRPQKEWGKWVLWLNINKYGKYYQLEPGLLYHLLSQSWRCMRMNRGPHNWSEVSPRTSRANQTSEHPRSDPSCEPLLCISSSWLCKNKCAIHNCISASYSEMSLASYCQNFSSHQTFFSYIIFLFISCKIRVLWNTLWEVLIWSSSLANPICTLGQ